jgi:uncharacterized protein YbgA (DUF1722 family)/uncharacterized protein YbbK (DUF523 family)
MQSFAKPIILCSRCLGFEACRYNAQIIFDSKVKSLKPYVEFITPCPEKDIGLGVPRHPVRVVENKDGKIMIQPSTGLDLTEKMKKYVDELLGGTIEVDGFILKSKSPSCGVGNVKIYGDSENPANFKKGDGLFGGEVKRKFRTKVIEDEARLSNHRIHDHFLKKIFTLAEFRKVKKGLDIKQLIDFQAKNKLLLMSYSQKELRILGRIVASHKKRNLDDILTEYERHLELAMIKGPTFKSNINVLNHAFGYVSKKITKQERDFFLDCIQMYRDDRTPLESCVSMLSSWIIRFDVDYLKQQSFFHPYPEDLRLGVEPDRRREFWQ